MYNPIVQYRVMRGSGLTVFSSILTVGSLMIILPALKLYELARRRKLSQLRKFRDE